MRPPRLAILPDFREEEWPSMDLCAEMLLRELRASPVQATRICPPFRRRLSLLFGKHHRLARNLDRYWNRYWSYPGFVKRQAASFDCFHVVDHSYAHLLNSLPAGRAGVYCHDLDAFRCLLTPQQDPRPRWFRALARQVLAGFQKAAIVFYNSAQVAGELLQHGLFDARQLIHAPLGVAPEFLVEAPELLPLPPEIVPGQPFLLHVGSCIPRKRIDLLLNLFAAVRSSYPQIQLVKVSGDWAPEHLALIRQHDLEKGIVHLHGLSRSTLAALYSRAALVLLPSDAEGFGIPVIEALACGGLMLVSDLPSTREAGNSAAVYAPPGDLAAWASVVDQLLRNPDAAPARATRRAWGRQFSWSRQAGIIADAYLRL
jgi:glycosyltransferase involved in cell wall biosynthesis